MEKDIKTRQVAWDTSAEQLTLSSVPRLAMPLPKTLPFAFSYPLQRSPTASHHMAGMLPTGSAAWKEPPPFQACWKHPKTPTPNNRSDSKPRARYSLQRHSKDWKPHYAKVCFLICYLNHSSETNKIKKKNEGKKQGVVPWGDSRSLMVRTTIFRNC